MTNKLVVIINSLKVSKIKKILLYEMKFLVPNYSCLQNPWLGGYRPQIPVLCPQLNLLNPPPSPEQNFWVLHWAVVHVVDLSADGGYKIRMDYRDVECDNLDWNQLAWSWGQWRPSVNTVLYHPFSEKQGFLYWLTKLFLEPFKAMFLNICKTPAR